MSMVKMINDYRYRVLPHLDWWRGGSHPHIYRLHVTSNLLRTMKVEHDFYKFEEFKWEGRQKCEIKLLLSPFVLIEWHFRMNGTLNSSVSTVNRLLAGQLRNRVRSPTGQRILFSSQCLVLLQGSLNNPLFNGYCERLPRDKADEKGMWPLTSV